MAKVDIRRTELEDGTVTFTVHIVGLNPTPPVTDVHDYGNSFAAGLGLDTEVAAAVREAMRQAGIGPDDPVMLVGHSLGALTAANLAQDDEFRSHYNLQSVVAVGATISGRDIDPPTTVLQITNPNDDVVQATKVAGGPNRMRGRSNYIEHEVHFGIPKIPGMPIGGVVGAVLGLMQAHPLSKYQDRLRGWDGSNSGAIAWREKNTQFLCGDNVKSSTITEYDVSRELPFAS